MKKLIPIIVCLFLSSCACYHCPRVYRNRVGVPTSVEVPHRKNVKQNKYSPTKPYNRGVTKNK